jgi:hypothetical protein
VRRGGGQVPSSASMVSPGSTCSLSEYSGSESASGFTNSALFSMRSLPSQPLLLLGVVLPLEASCPSASSSLRDMCDTPVSSFSEDILRIGLRFVDLFVVEDGAVQPTLWNARAARKCHH